MCGIFGYIGNRKASSILLKGLKSLEYRGYDSCGIAVINSRIDYKKDVGKIDEISKKLNFDGIDGNVGIGHNRWATHGEVITRNAHPHFSCDGKIAVVHNGIIENYQEIKDELISRGHIFSSETDSEVISHLVEDFMNNGHDLRNAVIATSKKLRGSFAYIILSENNKDKIIGVRYKSPLVVGVGRNENFLASDVVPFLEHTKNAIFLNDGEIVEMTKDDFVIYNFEGKKIKRDATKINWNAEEAKKAGFEHFMIKEIFEQGRTIERVIQQEKDKIKKAAKMINDAYGVFLVGCGTSYHACLTAQYWFTKITKKHVNVILASEFPNFSDFLTEDTLMIAVSQSGETADVLEAVREAKRKGVKVLSLVNVMGSTLMRMSDFSLMLNAGPEICVVATKSYISQLVLLGLLAYTSVGKLEEGKIQINSIIDKINFLLSKKNVEKIKKLAERLRNSKDIFLIGRGVNYPTALEGALKIKEVSYIHAEGFAGGELKHGTLALIDKDTPCIAIVPNDETKDDILSNAMEIKSRGGFIIGIADENNYVFDYFIEVPNENIKLLHPILTIIPLQLLSYYLAVLRGCDPDYPKNLAKCVTVL